MDGYIKDEYLFALDIGTRTVIGIVCKKEENNISIVAESMAEHDSRCMIDGQVHDVAEVASSVLRVKKELEDEVGFELKNVAIAAAGRTLKTKCTHVEQQVYDELEVDQMMIDSLEMFGVGEATKELKKDMGKSLDDFYCVGYSVVSYYLNGYHITNLLNQKGNIIGADVLATFLPQTVINSLYKVLDMAGLNPICLTLEPIAAIEAVVPENIRLLNIALVDIGAGTSDIAITKGGTIVSYGMVSVAGDEVTEAIVDKYIVDFKTAEDIKRKVSIGKRKKISFKDILGSKVTLESKDIMPIIYEGSKKLAKDISKEILKYNIESPKAVFCVGGGSKLPKLMENFAEELNMDSQRIAIRERNSIPNLKYNGKLLEGPEGVTVVGIAMIAYKKAGHHFIRIYLNNREYSIFNSGDLSLGEGLSLIGYNPISLLGKSGKSISYTLNGEKKKVLGEQGISPLIYINDNCSNLMSNIKDGDYIKIVDAKNGKDASLKVNDCLTEYHSINYSLNGRSKSIEPMCTINGKNVGYDTDIKDGDSLFIEMPQNILEQAAINKISFSKKALYVNKKEVDSSYMIKEGDNVLIEDKPDVNNIQPQFIDNSTSSNHLKSNSNLDTTTVTVNGKTVDMAGKENIFVDIFKYIDFDLSKPRGIIVLKLNGGKADYTQRLKDGDVLEIYWDKSNANNM
jgi:cell division protein FtsA